MNMFFDWWFATSPRLRQLCWAFWLLMLVTLIFLSSTHHEERDALIRLRQVITSSGPHCIAW
ncbi:protein involved in utilization of DNA as a carbon source [Escherichia coli]|uniref:Protein involved in utilization of DNA as a carbon source n=1 Tax=Escherichia coli TaxID=562 RepID=A0A376Y2U3_ECOLX|nr:protein involved in utilization of DNA as a carbon source [Escherichia coli]